MKIARRLIMILLAAAVAPSWAAAVDATGGTVTETNGYVIHAFTNVGTTNFTVTVAMEIDVLVVGGGGGGGSYGAGGAGGLIEHTISVSNGSYSIVVGGGGASNNGSSPRNGSNGGNSSAFELTAYGGGGGGAWQTAGFPGGSGGGAGGDNQTGGAGTSGQGSSGGNSSASVTGARGGGGGGFSQAGEASTGATTGRRGGDGIDLSLKYGTLYGDNGTFAGGGGGGSNQDSTPAPGGLGGGGQGDSSAAGNQATAGVPTSGGGGGGGAHDGSITDGAPGGSGIVIVRYFVGERLAVAAEPATDIGATEATLNGRVTDTGREENPQVHFCWGFTDGGTATTGAWDRVTYVGANWGMGETFSTKLTGLLSGSSYVYRVYATNSTGEAWSLAARHFTTVYLPSVTNMGAVLGDQVSTWLQAEVTDTGGQTPTAGFEWWAAGGSQTNGLDAGLQSGAFSAMVAGFDSNRTNYFRAWASNVAGKAWSHVVAFERREWFVKPGGDDNAAGTSWETALASPQVALDRAGAGDTVTVTNGNYLLTAVLTVDKSVRLRSVEGATATIMDANTSASWFTIWPVYRQVMSIAADALVEGFTLQGGHSWQNVAGVAISAGTLRDCIVRENRTRYGVAGTALVVSGSSLVERCIIRENSQERDGIHVLISGGTFRNSLVTANSSCPNMTAIVSISGGAIEHCTIAGNAPYRDVIPGLRITGGSVVNSIIYHNRRADLPAGDPHGGMNVARTGGTITHSIMAPLIAGTGNVDLDPGFVDLQGGDFRLMPGSPAIDAAFDLELAVDLDGNPRSTDGNGDGAAAPDMGAFEAAAATFGELRCGVTIDPPVAVGANEAVRLTAHVAGAETNIVWYAWDFGNGQTAAGADLHEVTADYGVGVHTVRLWVTNDLGQDAAIVRSNAIYVAPEILYVATNGAQVFPFATIENAARNIQLAYDAAAVSGPHPPSRVAVDEGTYANLAYHPVRLYKGVEVSSLKGPARTVINGAASGRGANLSHPSAVLEGFSITGVNVASSAWNYRGGGAYINQGTLRDSWVVSNECANAAGIYLARGLVDRCRIIGNRSSHGHVVGQDAGGGGILITTDGVLRNSLVAGNSAHNEWYAHGAGIVMYGNARVENCTVVDNIIHDNRAAFGAGIYRHATTTAIRNTIVWHNRTVSGTVSDFRHAVNQNGIEHSLSPTLAHEVNGNLPEPPPAFVNRPAGDYRLDQGSVGIDAGMTLDWMTPGSLDLAGNLRVIRKPDIGAFETQPLKGTLIMIR